MPIHRPRDRCIVIHHLLYQNGWMAGWLAGASKVFWEKIPKNLFNNYSGIFLKKIAGVELNFSAILTQALALFNASVIHCCITRFLTTTEDGK